MARQGRRLLAGGTVAWAAAFGFWLLLVGDFAVSEVLAGAAAALLVAFTAVLAAAALDARFRPRLAWLLEIARLPGRFAADLGLLGVALWTRLARGRRVTGSFEAAPRPAVGAGARRATRQALLTLLVSFTPNTIVVGFDPDRDVVLVHRLVAPRHARPGPNVPL